MGLLSLKIDEITHCLKDANGNDVKTYVTQIKSSAELKGYTSREWYVNWSKMLTNNEVFALRTADGEIQGLAAVENDKEASTALLSWIVAAPWNNPQKLKGKPKKYYGVGGHLFAIGVERSMAYGYDGVLLAHPSNQDVMRNYIEKLGAQEFPISNGYLYTVVVWEEAARKLMEDYDYEKRY